MTKREYIMAQKLDLKKLLPQRNWQQSSMFQIEALLRLLVNKGIITQQEYIDEMKPEGIL